MPLARLVLPPMLISLDVGSRLWSRVLPTADTGASDNVAVLAFRVNPKPFAGLVNIREAREAVEAIDPDLFLPLEGCLSAEVDSRLDRRGSLLIRWRQRK